MNAKALSDNKFQAHTRSGPGNIHTICILSPAMPFLCSPEPYAMSSGPILSRHLSVMEALQGIFRHCMKIECKCFHVFFQVFFDNFRKCNIFVRV